MGKQEFITSDGLRQDGRRAKELRRISCQVGVLQDADGSAMFEMGNTQASMLHQAWHAAEGQNGPLALLSTALRTAAAAAAGAGFRVWPKRG